MKTARVIVRNHNDVFAIKANDSLWENKTGASCATLIRYEESPESAAQRVLEKELGLKGNPKFVGKEFHNFEGVKRFLYIFEFQTDKQPIINEEDIRKGEFISITKARELIESGETMPTFDVAIGMLKSD